MVTRVTSSNNIEVDGVLRHVFDERSVVPPLPRDEETRDYQKLPNLASHSTISYPNCYEINAASLLLLLDLSKAFDSVEHKRLLQKISNLGIAIQWFQSYLANRSHAVQLENTISSPIQTDFGVPQGFILGPLLFSIFINDFPSMPSNTRISMYADDVQIAMTSAPIKLSQTKSNAEILLKHVKLWYDQNGLKLNASKTQCIIFGSKNTIKKLPNLTLLLGNDIIEPVGKVKNLGV
ncbi:Reverse transcriptase domain [Trinorchestia longiramus]|nr:Reverse transcriptase domain [Trinorchestia longiramus]